MALIARNIESYAGPIANNLLLKPIKYVLSSKNIRDELLNLLEKGIDDLIKKYE